MLQRITESVVVSDGQYEMRDVKFWEKCLVSDIGSLKDGVEMETD